MLFPLIRGCHIGARDTAFENPRFFSCTLPKTSDSAEAINQYLLLIIIPDLCILNIALPHCLQVANKYVLPPDHPRMGFEYFSC